MLSLHQDHKLSYFLSVSRLIGLIVTGDETLRKLNVVFGDMVASEQGVQ